ncbi:MAG: O-antigen ligase family protein, partial [Lachnospiraceae bacterium]|nr:O-antigen ligase family protein [Lachnospiraceae bacterium]
IYQTSIFEYMVILGFALFSCHGFRIRSDLMFFEILMLLFPLFFLTAEAASKYMFFTLVGIYYYFRIQEDYEMFYAIRLPIMAFGVFTALVTWFSFFFPFAYVGHVLPLLPESEALAYSFTRRNMYMGFTTHYSRNAFYILLAIQLLFSELYCRKGRKMKKSLPGILLLLFLFLTELLVAKRGPLLFLILSLMLLVILKDPGLSGKLKKTMIYAAAVFILGVLAVWLVPGADNIVVRMAASIQTGDITTGRLALYRVGVGMFLEHPLFGCGWDSFRRVVWGATDQGVHNDYIQLLGETGIIGFLMVMTANFYGLAYTMRAYRRFRGNACSGTREQIGLSFCLAYQIFFLLDSLTGLPHFSYEINTLYLMTCGYGVGVYQKSRRAELAEAEEERRE